MFRAFFRRLPLAASLVVLVSFALFVPAAHAASLVPPPVCDTSSGDGFQHCYVSLGITAPALNASSGISNIGISSDMQFFNPTVGHYDLESVTQMVAFGCWPSCAFATQKFTIEFGWMVAPTHAWKYPPSLKDGTIKPSGTDSSTHLFVFVRKPSQSCLVEYDPANSWNGQGWTCGWNSNYSLNGSSDYPDEVLTPGTSGHFVIVYSNGSWWLGYNNNWIGNVDGNWFGKDPFGNYLFTSIAGAEWSGEVALLLNTPTTGMGNGKCGTNISKSAQISDMQLAESGFHYGALDSTLSPSKGVTYPQFYNGSLYTSINPTWGYTQSNLAYGGPSGCH